MKALAQHSTLLAALVFQLLSLGAQAQVLPPDSLASDSIPAPRFATERDSLFFFFPETFSQIMGNSGNGDAIQVARDLLRFWDEEFGLFNDEQRNYLFDFTYKAWEKGLRPAPDLSLFFKLWWNSLDGTALSEEQLLEFLELSETILEESDRVAWLAFITNFDRFFRRKALYNQSSHQLILDDSLTYRLLWVEAPLQQRLDDLGLRENFREQIGTVPYAMKGQPVLEISTEALYLYKAQDSLVIHKPKGDYYLLSDLWMGSGGEIDWAMAGYDSGIVVTSLRDYLLRPAYPELRAENTFLHYPDLIEKPVEGTFEFRTLRTSEGILDYPRFNSYSNDIELRIKAETEFVYRGGIALVAKALKSTLEPNTEAGISIWRGEEKRMQASLAQVDFLDSMITSPSARIVIYHGQDSIYHNSIQFRYKPYHSELTLVKDRSNFRKSPFVSNLFKVDLFADMMRWNTAEDQLEFQILSSNDVVPAVIESHDYFDMGTFVSTGAMYDFHPLVVVVNYAREINNPEFYLEAVMYKTGKSREVIHNLLMNLASDNFIEYNPATGAITILRKGFHYVLSSRRQKDFDRIRIESISRGGPNIVLDIGQNSMDVRGVEEFAINEQKGIFIRPGSKSITLGANRDINFNGAMKAGNYEFAGEAIKFSYDEFKVDLPKIDTINMAVARSKVAEEGPVVEQAKVHNQMRQTSGSIILDDPKNKSARRSSPAYPSFESTAGSTLYFDSPGILNGAYDQRLYVEIPPFKIDSTDSRDASQIKLDGRFIGGGVLDDFDVTVYVKQDNSFGFEKQLPAEGWSILDGKARIFDKVTMSSAGLQAFGEFEMLNGSLNADTLTIFTDSLYTKNARFSFKGYEKGGYSIPPMEGFSPELRWNTLGDSLRLYTDSLESFALFGDKIKFEGEMLLTQSGSFGQGFVRIFDGELQASQFQLGRDFMEADSATLIINSELEDIPLMRGSNLRARFNNARNQVELSPENGFSEILEFPFTQLKTEMTSAVWNVDKNTIDIKSPESLDGSSRFIAEREGGDNLVIDASGAVYDLNAREILISGISQIPVADGYLTPEGGRLSIKESGDISEFKNASLVLDSINQWHKIIEADVVVLSPTRFEASGFYEYTNQIGKSYKIRFDSFQWREGQKGSSGQLPGYTYGAGYVNEKDELELSPRIFFKGDVAMTAFKPALEMQGFIKFDLKSFPTNKAWIAYRSDGTETGITIDLEKSVTEFGIPVSAGLHVGMSGLYATFMSDKKDDFDHDLFRPRGSLVFDTQNGSYTIRDELAYNQMALAQTSFVLNDENRKLTWEGLHSFMEKATPIVLEAGAKGEGNLESGDFSLKGLMHLQLKTPSKLLDTLGYSLKNYVEMNGLPPAILDRTGMAYNLAHLIGEAPARTWEQGSMLKSTPVYNASPKMAKGILLNDLPLIWSQSKKAFYGHGNAGLSHFNSRDLNTEADIYLELKKSGFGDEMNLLIRIRNNAWVFFRWTGDELQVYSSIENGNRWIEENTNIYSAGQGETLFSPARLSDAKGFIERYVKTYIGSGEIPELDMESAPAKGKKSGF